MIQERERVGGRRVGVAMFVCVWKGGVVRKPRFCR